MLNSDNLKKAGFFDPTMIAQLGDSVGAEESISAAGVINLGVYRTRIAVSGTMAFTLPDGTVAGQRKRIVIESAASIPAATLTITTPDTTTGFACPGTVFFDTAGQQLELTWTGAKWRVTDVRRAGTATVVVATTVLTGLCMYVLYALSVTGTVNSTGTKALPNGLMAGDACTVGCSTAATIPHGSIDAVVNLASGAAGSGGTGGLGKLADFTATTSNVNLEWNGTAWQVVGSIGSIVAS